MPQLVAELNPPGEHLSEFATGFVGRGTEGGRALAFWVLCPPSNEGSVFISDFFGGRPSECSVQPALNRKLCRGLRHIQTISLQVVLGLS